MVVGSIGFDAVAVDSVDASGSTSGRFRGKPSSSRRSIHSAAVSRIRRRMVAKAFARSVVEMAPRASSTLNAWLDFRMKLCAGTGRRFSTMRAASPT